MSLEICRVLPLPKISDHRGSLTFIENKNQIPFEIKRVYYLYDVPNKFERGEHAHKALHQLMIAISGNFDVILDDGILKKRFRLAQPYEGLYICPMIWRTLSNFSRDAVCLVLASNLFDENDYYRDYDEFLRASKHSK